MKLTRPVCLYYLNHTPRGLECDQPRRKWLPRRLLLVRHGESIANVHREVYSTTPDWHIPLTARGREQARDCGRRLREIIGDEKLYIYYSPYERTKQTLHEIRKSFSDAQIQGEREDERLREQEIGNYQPMESMDKHWEARASFSRLYYRFPDGESSADVGDRVSAFFDSLLRERLGLAVPNMNDESFNESTDQAVDLTLVDDWCDGDATATPQSSISPISEADRRTDGPTDASLADVHKRFAHENCNYDVCADVDWSSMEPSNAAPSGAMGGPPLTDEEALAVRARWQHENNDPLSTRPWTAVPTDDAAMDTPPSRETDVFSAPSVTARWCNGSGPARMTSAAMAADLDNAHTSTRHGGPGSSSRPASARVRGRAQSCDVPPLPPPPDSDADSSMADDQNVIIVSHGLLIRLFIGRWFRIPMEVFETMSNPPNCAIVVLERDSSHERLVMTDMSKSLFGSDPLLQMMKFDGKEDTQWYREKFLGIIDPELSPVNQLGEDDDENHYSLSTMHNSALGAPLPRPRPRVATTQNGQSESPTVAGAGPDAPASAHPSTERSTTASPAPGLSRSSSPTAVPMSQKPTRLRDARLSAIDRYYDTKK